MASKTKVTPQKEEMPEKEGPETPPDGPLLDRSNASVKALIRTAKKRGYVTHDQINSLMKEVNSEQIENVLAMFSEMGINVVEEAETEEASEEAPEAPEEEETDGELVKQVPPKVEEVDGKWSAKGPGDQPRRTDAHHRGRPPRLFQGPGPTARGFRDFPCQEPGLARQSDTPTDHAEEPI